MGFVLELARFLIDWRYGDYEAYLEVLDGVRLFLELTLLLDLHVNLIRGSQVNLDRDQSPLQLF